VKKSDSVTTAKERKVRKTQIIKECSGSNTGRVAIGEIGICFGLLIMYVKET